MPFIKLQFRPGVNRDQTDYTNEGGWYECDKIRFRSGYPEKLGGWRDAAAGSRFIGTCRQMWNWITSFSDNLLAIGTNIKVYIGVPGGPFFDITPLRDVDPTITSPNTNNSVSVTDTLNTVTFTLGEDPATAVNNYVVISGVTGSGSPAAIGGIPITQINGNRKITAINVSANSFTITTTTNATSNVASAGGTAINVSFEIEPGFASATNGYGWGTGTWSRGAWGSSSTSPILLPQTDWWFDNYENDLVMNIRNGQGYWWERGTAQDPGTALATKAIRLADYATAEGYDPNAVPSKIGQLLVSQQAGFLIAFGAVPFPLTATTDFDPLVIRWANQGAPANWTESNDALNTAGSLRVSRGSRIIRALPTRQEILVWTDTHLYTLQQVVSSDVFALQEYADNISIMSPRACASAANITYWMGQDKFYAYTGRVETLPCSLRNHVFTNINLNQAEQIICGTNEQWNEVWWFYPTANSQWNDAYVVYNHLDKIWYYGTLERTAWLDTSVRFFPQGATTPQALANEEAGILYNHEDGLDDDGAAIEAFIQSSDFDLDDGDRFILTRRIIPDISFDTSTATNPEVTMEIRSRNFPGSALTSGQDTERVIQAPVGTYTGQVFVRARARQMALKIMSDQAGVQWQLGSPRLDGRPDGAR